MIRVEIGALKLWEQIKNCNLSAEAMITPSFMSVRHACNDGCHGQASLAMAVQARSEAWTRTLWCTNGLLQSLSMQESPSFLFSWGRILKPELACHLRALYQACAPHCCNRPASTWLLPLICCTDCKLYKRLAEYSLCFS